MQPYIQIKHFYHSNMYEIKHKFTERNIKTNYTPERPTHRPQQQQQEKKLNFPKFSKIHS